MQYFEYFKLRPSIIVLLQSSIFIQVKAKMNETMPNIHTLDFAQMSTRQKFDQVKKWKCVEMLNDRI